MLSQVEGIIDLRLPQVDFSGGKIWGENVICEKIEGRKSRKST